VPTASRNPKTVNVSATAVANVRRVVTVVGVGVVVFGFSGGFSGDL
jgi:hypothetical protein